MHKSPGPFGTITDPTRIDHRRLEHLHHLPHPRQVHRLFPADLLLTTNRRAVLRPLLLSFKIDRISVRFRCSTRRFDLDTDRPAQLRPEQARQLLKRLQR